MKFLLYVLVFVCRNNKPLCVLELVLLCYFVANYLSTLRSGQKMKLVIRLILIIKVVRTYSLSQISLID